MARLFFPGSREGSAWRMIEARVLAVPEIPQRDVLVAGDQLVAPRQTGRISFRGPSGLFVTAMRIVAHSTRGRGMSTNH